MYYSNYAVNDESRVQKSQKIISCVEYALKQKFQGKRVLEIGAGSGIISHYIMRAGNDVVSIDIDFNLYNSTDFPEKKISFMVANAVSLPFKDKTFDIIICNQVIEHIQIDEQSDLIGEIFRTLNTGGLLYLATPNKIWPVEPHTRLPFITYFSQKTADVYVNVTKRTKNFNVYLLTYSQLTRILESRFDYVEDITPFVIKNPDLFLIKDEIPKSIRVILMKVPLKILQKISPFYPSWIFIGRK